MDALTEVLSSIRIRSTVYCPLEIGAPWGLHIAEEIGAPFFILIKGTAFLAIDELNIRRQMAETGVILGCFPTCELKVTFHF